MARETPSPGVCVEVLADLIEDCETSETSSQKTKRVRVFGVLSVRAFSCPQLSPLRLCYRSLNPYTAPAVLAETSLHARVMRPKLRCYGADN